MTQAFNLAQLANKVNTSGQLDAATGLVNAVPVANGGLALSAIAARSIPVANVANTYTTLTPTASQSIRINAGNTAWEAFTPGTGTVTSVATGNGLSGGAITTTGTLTIAAPGFNTVGAYVYGTTAADITISSGGTIAAGGGTTQLKSMANDPCGPSLYNNLSGTWRNMGGTFNTAARPQLWCRVA